MCVQVFFNYFTLVIGTLIAEVIGAFWAVDLPSHYKMPMGNSKD